ncbi:unnamed protein product, partial [Ectocarpus sp. 8 AP-2014]
RLKHKDLDADIVALPNGKKKALQDAVQEELLLAQGQAEHERAAAQAQQQVLQQEVERLETRAAMVEEEAGRAGRLEEEAADLTGQLRASREKASGVASLEAEREGLVSRSRETVQSERAAVAGCAEAEARAKSVERSSEIRVRKMEAEAARLRQQLESGADATEVKSMREKIRILEGIWGDADVEEGDEGEWVGSMKGHVSTGGEGAAGGERTHPHSPSPAAAEGVVEEGPQHGAVAEGEGSGVGGDCNRALESEGASGKLEGAVVGEMESGREGGGDAGVDAWLISYNRRLKNELERLRERTRQAEERLRIVEEERVAEAAELSDRRQDVKRLEQDLVDAHQVVEAGKTMLRAFQSGPVAKQFGKLIGRRGDVGGGVDDVGPLEDDLLEGVEEAGGVEGVPGAEGFSAADRLLGAVKRQRERFRKEALRREREASIAKGNAEQLTRDNQDLRRENMHLYKKMRQADPITGLVGIFPRRVRFVMSYGGKGGGGGGGGGLEDAGGDGERETESKYERLYEADLDPFKEFDSQEKEARRGQMGFLERWLFLASGTVLRNRFRRHLLLVYLLVLHGFLLVMPGGRGGNTPGIGI